MDFELNEDNINELSKNYDVDEEIIRIFIKMINYSERVTFQEQFNYILENCISLVSSYQDIFICELESNIVNYSYPTYNAILTKVICDELGVSALKLLDKYDVKCSSLFKTNKEEILLHNKTM